MDDQRTIQNVLLCEIETIIIRIINRGLFSRH